MILPTASKSQLTAISIFIGVVYFFTGLFAVYYPGRFEYLSYPTVWAVGFMLAGIFTFLFVIFKTIKLAVVAGALLIGSALIRGSAILIEIGLTRMFRLIFNQAEKPINAPFIIGAWIWVLVGFLLWIGWPAITAKLMYEKEEHE